MRKNIFAAALMVLTLFSAPLFFLIGPASATVAYTPPETTGNQAWSGSLGMGFDTNADIQVLSLGVFDSGQNGIPAGTTLYAAIFDRGTKAIVVPTITFTTGTGSLVGSSIFSPVTGGPVLLPAGGHYTITAWGFNSSEPNGNIYYCVPSETNPAVFNSGGGLISEGVATYSATPGAYPDLGASFYKPGQYWAGTFDYVAYVVPLPSTLILLGFGLVGLAGLGWRSRKI